MRYLIVGGTAAATKVAARAKRCDRAADVLVVSPTEDVAFSRNDLPYYLDGGVRERDGLIVDTAEKLAGHTSARVLTGLSPARLDAAAREVAFLDGDGAERREPYDRLVVACGVEVDDPPLEGAGLPGAFCLRTPSDAEALHAYVGGRGCRRAVVVGADAFGLQCACALLEQGLSVTVVEPGPHMLDGDLDPEMADFSQRQLKSAGLRVLTRCTPSRIAGEERVEGVVTDTAGTVPADVVVASGGVRPATGWLEGSGLELADGAVKVDEYGAASLPDAYAAGDCALQRNAITGATSWSRAGSGGNGSARALGSTVAGTPVPQPGTLGTRAMRLLPVFNAARSGLGEAEAREAGFDVETMVALLDEKPKGYPGAENIGIKLVADRATHRLLGVQSVGAGEVDKIVDVAVEAMHRGLAIEDLDLMDFSAAPPFAPAVQPLVAVGYMLEEKLAGTYETFTPVQYAAGEAAGYDVIDLHSAPTVPGARWLDFTKVNGPIEGIDPSSRLLLVCGRARFAYFLQVRLKACGYTGTRVLEGGAVFNEVRVPRKAGKLPAAEVKRLKGLGCLQDKRFGDVFNIRVITRNGKLTAAEQKVVAEASETFGSGEVTMTTRLTLEVQGVPYEKVEDCIAFLQDRGLDAGGTGSKVRPVVSCKGTTCQYGLIDTFALSERLHERFYVGYHGVELPHKFKIAVGGCPNMCVKPDLNDLGIVGQLLPEAHPEKCRRCKVCQVEKVCPLGIAHMAENGLIAIDEGACNRCGVCVGRCPFGAVTESLRGYKVFVGGRWGKRTARGRALDKLFLSEDEVLDVVERAILFFRDEGLPGERFSGTIERLGFDYVQEKLLHAPIDKDAILQKTVMGGATC